MHYLLYNRTIDRPAFCILQECGRTQPISSPGSSPISKLADGLGFEPRQADPESAVLPLHPPSIELREPREDRLAAKDLHHLKEPSPHGLAAYRDPSRMYEFGRLQVHLSREG